MNYVLKISLILFLIIISCNSAVDDNVSVNVPPLKVYECDNDSIDISDEAKDALMAAGMTQCMMPFGVLLSADQNMPKAYLEMSGKILAELLDQDLDGIIDDSSLFTFISDWQSAWLAMPTDHDEWEDQQLPILSNKLGYDIIIPSWWMGTANSVPSAHSIAVMVEEITHFLTQFGYGPRYPEKFGVESWSSIIAQETLNARCTWWQHPENDCPDSPAQYAGDCSDPNCDVVEFYHQVLILRAGMVPGWFGINFPTSSDLLEELLSDEIKELMDDANYHQIRTPLTYNYPIVQ